MAIFTQVKIVDNYSYNSFKFNPNSDMCEELNQLTKNMHIKAEQLVESAMIAYNMYFARTTNTNLNAIMHPVLGSVYTRFSSPLQQPKDRYNQKVMAKVLKSGLATLTLTETLT